MIIKRLIKRRKNLFFTLWELNSSSFEQTWIPFTQGCTVEGLVEIGPVVLEKKIFNFCQYILFGKGQSSSFEQTWIPFIKECFLPSFVEIDPVVLEKKMKMWIVYNNNTNDDDNDNDDGQKKRIGKAHLILGLRWAKKYWFITHKVW